MKSVFYILLLLLGLSAFAADGQPAQKTKKQQVEMQDSINGIYIPKDIDDCMTELDKMLDDSLKCEIRKMSADEFQAKAHFGLGMWMRNNYGLWQGSRLAVYIRKNCDVRHPDDMSGVILSSYYNHLTVGNEKD